MRLVYICWAKGHRVFSAIHFENKLRGTGRRSQTASGCGVDFVLVLREKKGHRCSMCGPVLKVRLRKRREGIDYGVKRGRGVNKD